VAEDVTFRFEVLLGERWLPYTAEALGVADDDVGRDLAGDHELECVWQDAVEFARQELDGAVARISPEDPGLVNLAGVRIALWAQVPAQGEPDVVIRASQKQLAIGRLRYAADEVTAAVRQLRDARGRLRAQVLTAATVDHLGRNQIAREVERTWSRRLVLQFLSGHDLIRDVRRALPSDWPRSDGYVFDYDDEPWEQRLGPFRCGPVKLELSSVGQVELRIVDTEDHPDVDDADDAEIRAYQAAGRQRALAAAEVVHAALGDRGLRLSKKDGTAVTVEELARIPVTVARQ
jgi:hypothetical protein